MDRHISWISNIPGILGWILLIGLVATVAWWAWGRNLHRFLLLNGGHELTTVVCSALLPIAFSNVGHTDGFGAWKLVPIVIATPPVMLALFIWGLVARSRSRDRVHRRTALASSSLALVPLVAVALVILGAG
jgi:hypothetical protein